MQAFLSEDYGAAEHGGSAQRHGSYSVSAAAAAKLLMFLLVFKKKIPASTDCLSFYFCFFLLL